MKIIQACGTLAALLFCTCSGTFAAEATGEILFQERFQGKLADGWSFEREERANWRVGDRGLKVLVQPGNMWGGANNAKNVFVRSIPVPTDVPIQISVTFSNQPTAQWEQANLVWYYDGGNMVKLGQELVTGRLSIVMGREENDRARTVAIVPLDANEVELRLQAVNNRLRGQFRTAPWQEWRDIGECDLPVKGDPKASLHFYNGPQREEHWVRVNDFTVRRLPASTVDWPRVRVEEVDNRSTDNQRTELNTIHLDSGYVLLNSVKPLTADTKADYQQSIYRHQDGSYGWRWHRRASPSAQPTLVGIALGAPAFAPLKEKGMFNPVQVAEIRTLQMDSDAVTRLENDRGDHNFVCLLQFDPPLRLAIWFDWYGNASEVQTFTDGHRAYGFIPTQVTNEIQYRIAGFRGAPPRVNLKAFIEDAVKRGLSPQSQLRGIFLGNEIWNGSLGATLVTKMDLDLNGKRYSSVPARQTSTLAGPTLVASSEPGWPQWRGPRRDGICDETGLLQTWPEAGPKLLWKTDQLGKGYSCPVIVNDRIFITGDVADDLQIFAFDTQGQRLWQTPNGRAWKGPYPGARAACAFSNGRLYNLNAHGRLLCLDPEMGREVWNVDIVERFGGKVNTWAYSECLLVDGNRLFVTPGGAKALMAALDVKTGQTLWTTEPLKLGPSPTPAMQRVAEPPGETDSASYASPILVRWGDALQLINCSKRHAFGVDATNGRLLWTRPLKTRYEVIAATPVLVEDAVFVTAPHSSDARLHKFQRHGSEFDVSEAWSTKLDTCHGGLIYHADSLFGSFYSNGKGLACLDPQTGKVRYETTDLAKGSVLFADDRLYCLSEEGDMVLLDPTGTEFKTAGRFRLVQERKNDVWPHPVILNGRLYLRYHDTLYCYDVRKS